MASNVTPAQAVRIVIAANPQYEHLTLANLTDLAWAETSNANSPEYEAWCEEVEELMANAYKYGW